MINGSYLWGIYLLKLKAKIRSRERFSTSKSLEIFIKMPLILHPKNNSLIVPFNTRRNHHTRTKQRKKKKFLATPIISHERPHGRAKTKQLAPRTYGRLYTERNIKELLHYGIARGGGGGVDCPGKSSLFSLRNERRVMSRRAAAPLSRSSFSCCWK